MKKNDFTAPTRLEHYIAPTCKALIVENSNVICGSLEYGSDDEPGEEIEESINSIWNF